MESFAGKMLGLYFSAHWCGPCREFTPELVEFYDKVRDAPEGLEIVFVSSDRDAAGFHEYHASMPWPAVRFDNRVLRTLLGDKFGVASIPTLVFIDTSGKVVTKKGKEWVLRRPKGAALFI